VVLSEPTGKFHPFFQVFEEDNYVLPEEFDQLTLPEPAIDLVRCETLFGEKVPPPFVNVHKRTIFLHKSYVDHACVFALRLRITAYDKKRQCIANLHTSNEKSLNVTLRL